MYRLLMYAFPFILVLIEWALRTAMRLESGNLAAPSISAAACSLLLPPATQPLNVFANPLSDRKRTELLAGQLLLLVSPTGWIWCVVLVAGTHSPTLFSLELPTIIALTSFFLAIVFCEYRSD
jgi:hypothetical protein